MKEAKKARKEKRTSFFLPFSISKKTNSNQDACRRRRGSTSSTAASSTSSPRRLGPHGRARPRLPLVPARVHAGPLTVLAARADFVRNRPRAGREAPAAVLRRE